MRLMICYYNGVEDKIADIHSETLEITPGMCGAEGGAEFTINYIVEVPSGVDYDKTLYGQSVSMHPHEYPLMITKESSVTLRANEC